MIFKKIDPSILFKVNTKSNSYENIDCIIYSNNFYRTKNYLANLKNCIVYNEYPFINAFAVNIFPNNISLLSSINHINYITSQAKVFTQVNVAKKIMDLSCFANNNINGKDITIAFIDTGINPHLDFVYPKNRILFFKDFINNKPKPYDDNGHGTFVASVAAGNGICSCKKYSGVAPSCNIISLKALDNNGETGAFTILEAMQWVYDNHKQYNIKVVCMSFGSQPLKQSDPLLKGAEALWNEGITVVAAAGNSGPSQSTIKSPGISPKIITVGALNDNRDENGIVDENKFEVAQFSSRGPAFNYYKPDLITSGVNLVCCSSKANEFYTKMSGTSVSTPLIAGLSALIVQKFPTIKPIEVKSILLTNCKKLTGDRNLEGFGYFTSDSIKKLLNY